MIIHNLHAIYSPILKAKTHAPLIIDPYAPLPGSIALQRFQPVARWNAKILYRSSDIQQRQLSHGRRFYSGKTFDTLSFKQRLGIFAFKECNHGSIVSLLVTNVKRYYSVCLQQYKKKKGSEVYFL